MLQLAATVYGSGIDPRSGSGSMIQKWNTTSNALLNTAKGFHGSILLLDEIGECSGDDFTKSLDQVMSGVGKARANSSGQTIQTDDWKILGISSGEVSGLDKIKSSRGKEQMKGEAIRFLDINIIQEEIFSECIFLTDIATFIDELKDSCGKHGGHASRDFIHQLLALEDNNIALRKRIIAVTNVISANIILQYPVLSPLEKRVIRHLSLVTCAGLYAVEFGILNITEKHVHKATDLVINKWLNHIRQNVTAPYHEILRDYITKNISSFQDNTNTNPVSNCAGYIKKNYGETLYLIDKENFKELFKGLNGKKVCESLVASGFLSPDRDQYKRAHRISSILGNNGYPATMRFYTIHASIIDGNEAFQPLQQLQQQPMGQSQFQQQPMGQSQFEQQPMGQSQLQQQPMGQSQLQQQPMGQSQLQQQPMGQSQLQQQPMGQSQLQQQAMEQSQFQQQAGNYFSPPIIYPSGLTPDELQKRLSDKIKPIEDK